MLGEDKQGIGRRSFLAFAGGTAATAMLAGCLGDDDPDLNGEDDDADDGEPDRDDDSTLWISQSQDPTTLDPHDHRETTTDNVILQAYEFHLARDPDGELMEGLATEWEIVDDDRHQLVIREDVPFHEGDDLTPADCAFSINRVVDPDEGNLGSPQADQLAGIEGAEVDEDNDQAIIIHSGETNPTVFANLASYCPVMQEEWTMDREPEEVAEEMNGTGPYMLEEYVADEYTEFRAFPDYWDGEADIESLTIDAASESSTRINSLQAGEIDIATAVPPDDAPGIDGDDGLRIDDAPSTRILMLPMRYDVEPFSSQEFRQALNYAIDFETIVDEVLNDFGDATAQPTLEGYFGHNPDLEPYPYDPEEAERLIEESGYADEEITLEVPAGRYLQSDEIAQACVGYLDDLENLSCEIEMRDFGEMTDVLLDGDIETTPDFFLIGWGNTTFDAQQNLFPWFTEGTSQWTFIDEELEDLIFAAASEIDEDEREQLLMDACELAHDLAVFVFLNREYLIYGVNERVEWEPRQDEYQLAYEMSLR